MLCCNHPPPGQGTQRPQICQTQGTQPPVWTFCPTRRLEPGLSASAPTYWSADEDELTLVCQADRQLLMCCQVQANVQYLNKHARQRRAHTTVDRCRLTRRGLSAAESHQKGLFDAPAHLDTQLVRVAGRCLGSPAAQKREVANRLPCRSSQRCSRNGRGLGSLCALVINTVVLYSSPTAAFSLQP